MEIQFAIVRSKNGEYLCYKEDSEYVYVSNPMLTFADGEDEFEIINPDPSFTQKEYEFRGDRFHLVPRFYNNGWLAITLEKVEDEEDQIVLSVNLEKMDALGLPNCTFIDINNYPDALEFLRKKRIGNRFGI